MPFGTLPERSESARTRVCLDPGGFSEIVLRTLPNGNVSSPSCHQRVSHAEQERITTLASPKTSGITTKVCAHFGQFPSSSTEATTSSRRNHLNLEEHRYKRAMTAVRLKAT